MIDYDSIPAVRRSELWELRKSPMHYLYAVTHERPETPALTFGSAAHKYILEPDTFHNEYIVAPPIDRRTKTGKEAWAKLRESGKTVISEADMSVIEDMCESLMKNETAAKLIASGQHEVPIEWMDADTGERCKIRPDVLGDEYIVDYKTTASCEGNAFEFSCRKYGYKLQAGMYTEGVFCTTLNRLKFAFVAQEKEPPYATRVYFCDDGFVDEGIQMFHGLIELYHDCVIRHSWPGYEDKEMIGDERD